MGAQLTYGIKHDHKRLIQISWEGQNVVRIGLQLFEIVPVMYGVLLLCFGIPDVYFKIEAILI